MRHDRRMRCPLPAPDPDGWTIGRACGPLRRGRGLLGCDVLAAGHGLWLGTRSVHTVGMRFPLDLLWLDRAGQVLRLDCDVGSGRLRSCRRAGGGVIEVAAGAGAALAATLARPSRQGQGQES